MSISHLPDQQYPAVMGSGHRKGAMDSSYGMRIGGRGQGRGGGLIPDSFGIISALYPWAYSQRSSTNQSHKENFLNFFFFFLNFFLY